MIKTLIEVGDSAARSLVAVRAESIRQAMEFAKIRYPGSDARVIFPLDPETFFVKEAGNGVDLVEVETLNEAPR